MGSIPFCYGTQPVLSDRLFSGQERCGQISVGRIIVGGLWTPRVAFNTFRLGPHADSVLNPSSPFMHVRVYFRVGVFGMRLSTP